MSIYAPLKTTDEYFKGILASPPFAAEVQKVLSGSGLAQNYPRMVDSLIDRVLPNKKERRGIGSDSQELTANLTRLAECYPLKALHKLIEMLKKKLTQLMLIQL